MELGGKENKAIKKTNNKGNQKKNTQKGHNGLPTIDPKVILEATATHETGQLQRNSSKVSRNSDRQEANQRKSNSSWKGKTSTVETKAIKRSLVAEHKKARPHCVKDLEDYLGDGGYWTIKNARKRAKTGVSV